MTLGVSYYFEFLFYPIHFEYLPSATVFCHPIETFPTITDGLILLLLGVLPYE